MALSECTLHARVPCSHLPAVCVLCAQPTLCNLVGLLHVNIKCYASHLIVVQIITTNTIPKYKILHVFIDFKSSHQANKIIIQLSLWSTRTFMITDSVTDQQTEIVTLFAYSLRFEVGLWLWSYGALMRCDM